MTLLIILSLGVGPVDRETRMVYARAYLKRKYELQGHDPTLVTQDEIEALLVEIKLTDIVGIIYQFIYGIVVFWIV